MSIETIIAAANKKYGEGTIIKGSEIKELHVPRCTTGSLAFDVMLGGGWPLNQWNEIIGNESNGKTVMALKTIAANQALDPEYQGLWIAAEHFVPDWAETLGVDMSRLYVVNTCIMEEAYQIIVDSLDERAVDAVVVDSLPALVPLGEDEKTMQEFSVGLGARLTGQFMRKSGKAGRRSTTEDDRPCLALIINQWRSKIGVMYGDPRTTPGGKAKDYACFTRVELARDEWLTYGTGDNKARVGISIKGRTIKNKSFPPHRQGMVDFYFDEAGVFHPGEYDTFKEVLNLGMKYDVIKRRGAYYDYEGETWKGKEEVFAGLRQDVTLQAKLSEDVMAAVHEQLGTPL